MKTPSHLESVSDAVRETLDGRDGLKETIGNRVHHVVDDVTDRGARLAREMKHKVQRGAYNLSHKSLSELARDSRDYVKSHPGQVMLASAAAGFLLATLIRRNRETDRI